MSTPRLQTTLRLVSGESPIPIVRLVWGEPVAPISVGGEGNWQVRAPGVASRHLNFAFDGRQLFVALAAPGASAYLGGEPIDERWWPIQLPAEVHFGEAVIQASCEEHAIRPPAPARAPVAKPSQAASPAHTVLEGAGAWDAAHGRDVVAPKRMEPPAPSTVPKVYVPGPVEIRYAPAPMNQPLLQRPGTPGQLNVPAEPLVVPPGDTGMAATLRRPLTPHGAAPAPIGAKDFGARHIGIRPWAAPAPPVPDALPATAPEPVLPARSFAPLGPVAPAPPAPTGWHSLSPVKKAIAVLLPLAFAAVLWPEDPPPAPANSTARSPAAGASASARSATVSSARPTQSPDRPADTGSAPGQLATRPTSATSAPKQAVPPQSPVDVAGSASVASSPSAAPPHRREMPSSAAR